MLAMPGLVATMLIVQNDLSEMNMELLKLLSREDHEQPPLDGAHPPQERRTTGEAARYCLQKR
jgi:hypothetical protein